MSYVLLYSKQCSSHNLLHIPWAWNNRHFNTRFISADLVASKRRRSRCSTRNIVRADGYVCCSVTSGSTSEANNSGSRMHCSREGLVTAMSVACFRLHFLSRRNFLASNAGLAEAEDKSGLMNIFCDTCCDWLPQWRRILQYGGCSSFRPKSNKNPMWLAFAYSHAIMFGD